MVVGSRHELALPDWLGIDLRSRAADLRPARRVEWLQGRVVLHLAVSRWVGVHTPDDVDPGDVRIGLGALGEPRVEVPLRRPLSVSLAHGGDLVVGAAAAASRLLGIDIEPRTRNVHGLLPVLTAAERVLVESGTPALHLLVAKEAAAKAWKVGLGGSPRRWPVEDVAGTRFWISGPDRPAVPVDLHIMAEHVVGLCVEPRPSV